jgi:hypothetical protein
MAPTSQGTNIKLDHMSITTLMVTQRPPKTCDWWLRDHPIWWLGRHAIYLAVFMSQTSRSQEHDCEESSNQGSSQKICTFKGCKTRTAMLKLTKIRSASFYVSWSGESGLGASQQVGKKSTQPTHQYRTSIVKQVSVGSEGLPSSKHLPTTCHSNFHVLLCFS